MYKHLPAAVILAIVASLLLAGGMVGWVLTPPLVEWLTMLLPYRNIVVLLPMALGLYLAITIVRRMFPLPHEGRQ